MESVASGRLRVRMKKAEIADEPKNDQAVDDASAGVELDGKLVEVADENEKRVATEVPEETMKVNGVVVDDEDYADVVVAAVVVVSVMAVAVVAAAVVDGVAVDDDATEDAIDENVDADNAVDVRKGGSDADEPEEGDVELSKLWKETWTTKTKKTMKMTILPMPD